MPDPAQDPLRICAIPARIHYTGLRGEVLQGLTASITSIARPAVEAWVGAAWSATDTFIFDAGYIAGARARLDAEGLDWGYGISRTGQTLWAPGSDAFLAGAPDAYSDLFLGWAATTTPTSS